MKPGWRGPLLDLAALVAVLAVYAALSLPQLDLPGLYYDEAVDAVPAMQLLLGQPVELVRNAGVSVGGTTLPLMAMDYVGAVHTYAALPFFAALGIGPVPLRLTTVTGGALTLTLTYLLGRALFNRPVGALAALLLAVHPSFLFYVRQGVHVSSLLAVFTTGSLLALWRWWTLRRFLWLPVGTLLLGLGLTTKILFIWFIHALLTAFGLRLAAWAVGKLSAISRQPSAWFSPPRFGAFHSSFSAGNPVGKGCKPAPTDLALHTKTGGRSVAATVAASFGLAGAQAMIAAAAFLVGAGPLLVYNMKTGGTLQVLFENRGVTQSGVDNATYLTNLVTRLETLRALLDGGHFWFLGGLFRFSPYPWLLVALHLMLPVLLWLNRDRYRSFGPSAGLLAFLVVTVTLQSAFTVAGLWPTHLFAMLPFFTLLAASALVLLARWRGGMIASGGLALLFLAGSVVTDFHYHQALAETGGRRAHSDAVYRLSAYLDEQQDDAPFALDWGLKASVQLLTHGRVNPVEIFFYSADPPPLFTDWVYGAMHGAVPRHFIFHAADATVFPRLPQFLELAARWEREAVLETTIQERDGTPVYLVYTVR